MFKIISYGILFAIIGSLSVFLANNSGSVDIEWFGYQINTSVPVLVIFASFVFFVFNLIVLKPIRFFEQRAKVKKEDYKLVALLSSGLAAALSDDLKNAKKIEKTLLKKMGKTPLLSMVISGVEGKEEEKLTYCQTLLEDKRTNLLGLKGLVDIHTDLKEYDKALSYASMALKENKSEWAVKAVTNLQIKNNLYKDALNTLEEGKNIIKKDEYENMKISLLMKLSEINDDKEKYLEKVLKINKSFVPAIISLSAFYMAKSKDTKAFKVLKSGYTENPDVLIYEYMSKNFVNSDIVKITSDLIKENPDNDVSSLVMGESMMKAGIWGQALLNFKKYLKNNAPNAKIALSMARIEKELGNFNEMEKWNNSILNAEIENKWRCDKCNAEFNDWQSNCSNCGAFGTVKWNAIKNDCREIVPLS